MSVIPKVGFKVPASAEEAPSGGSQGQDIRGGAFVEDHPAGSVALAAAAGVVAGVALGAAPKGVTRMATAAIAGAAAAGFVSALRADWGMTREMFARLIGYGTRTIAGWEKGATVGKAPMRTLIKVQRLREALSRVMNPKFARVWMEMPNPAFDGLKPLEVWERGQEDQIWTMIYDLESGDPA